MRTNGCQCCSVKFYKKNWNHHILITVFVQYYCRSSPWCPSWLPPPSSCPSSPQGPRTWWSPFPTTPRTMWAASSPWRWAATTTTPSSPAPSTIPLSSQGKRGASRLCECCVSQLGSGVAWGGRRVLGEERAKRRGLWKGNAKRNLKLIFFFFLLNFCLAFLLNEVIPLQKSRNLTSATCSND